MSQTKKKESTEKNQIFCWLLPWLGYSDIAPFGGTSIPRISQLASRRNSVFNFYVQPTCSPLRSSLLTGNDNHVAGLGIMSEMEYPELTASDTFPHTRFIEQAGCYNSWSFGWIGYYTYMVCKWHLGEGPGKDPFDRGFQEVSSWNWWR